MTAKLDSALGGMQAEINALKSNAPALILSSNSPLSALPLPIGQFEGTQLLPPQTPLQLPAAAQGYAPTVSFCGFWVPSSSQRSARYRKRMLAT